MLLGEPQSPLSLAEAGSADEFSCSIAHDIAPAFQRSGFRKNFDLTVGGQGPQRQDDTHLHLVGILSFGSTGLSYLTSV